MLAVNIIPAQRLTTGVLRDLHSTLLRVSEKKSKLHVPAAGNERSNAQGARLKTVPARPVALAA